MDLANPSYFHRIGLKPEQIISLSGGWVNHESPSLMREVYARIACDRELFHICGGYSPPIGLPECRKAIASYEKHVYGQDMNLRSENIAIGSSSTQLTLNLLQVLISPGEKLMLFDPSYCNYPSQMRILYNIEILKFPVLDVERWQYVADERISDIIQFILTKRPKVVLLVAPDNPTSQIPSTALVAAILRAVEKINSFLILDLAYKELVWDTAKLPEYFSWGPTDHFVTIHSNSKWCHGLGRRLGWIEAPEAIVEAIAAVQSSSILCPDTLHQMALTYYINEGIACNNIKPYLADTAQLYQVAAKRTVTAIQNSLQLPCLTPQGGLYTVVHVGRESSIFSKEILEATGVIVVPGWGFGDTLWQAIRISYGPLVHDLEKIDIAIARMKAFVEKNVRLCG
jgi:aspartate/methionine/tyrosine aminotransferase